MERQLCSSLNHAGTKYPAGQDVYNTNKKMKNQGPDFRKVLLVEDAPLARRSYCEHLSKNGFHVLEAESICQAISALKKQTISVAVLDINLPDGDAYELINQIRGQDKGSTFTQFVIISADISAERAMHALRLSVFEILIKPFCPSELLDAVQRAASRTKELKERAEIEATALSTLKNLKLSADMAVERLTRQLDTADLDDSSEQLQWTEDKRQALIFLEDELTRLNCIIRVFGALISGSSWQMLLFMYEAHLKNSTITIKGVAASAGIPISTAIRKLGEMETAGFVERKGDPRDARRSFVNLTQLGLQKMQKFFSLTKGTKGRQKCTA